MATVIALGGLSHGTCVAQVRAVDATISVAPIETLRLGDFDPTNPSAAPLIFTVTVRSDATERRLRAVVRVVGERVGLLGTVAADLGIVGALNTVMLTNREFGSYDLADAASNVIDYATERGELPPDTYSFRLTVFEESDDVLAEDEDFAMTTDGGGQIFAISPGESIGDTPEVIETSQPVFLWQSDGTRFDFSLFEVVGAGSSADDIATGLPVFKQTGLEQTTFPYPAYAEQLKPGKTYAWLVETIVRTAAGDERIPGEMLWFTVRSDSDGEGLTETPGLASIRVEPQEAETNPSGVIQLSAEGFDANGSPLGKVDVGWEVVPSSGGEVTSSGLFTASGASAVVAIVAERDDFSDFATIAVTQGTHTPGSRDSAYVVMLSPSESAILVEPAPAFYWQVLNADSNQVENFRLSLGLVDEERGETVPLWARDVRGTTSMLYPSDQSPLQSGARYVATVALLNSAGAAVASSDPIEFALNRDPKISWELYNAWDVAQRTASDSLQVTMLALIGASRLTPVLRDQIAAAGATIEIAEGPWLQLQVSFVGLAGLAAIGDIRMMTLPSPHVLFHRDAAPAGSSGNAVQPAGSSHVTALLESTADYAPIDVAIFEFGFDREAIEEIIDPSRVRYHTFRRDNRISGAGGADALHGVATLKAMTEYLPPTATIHLVNFDTEPEFQQALRFAVEELNARIVTCSVSWANAYDDYDGTSFFSNNVRETLSDRAALVVAAGNFAQSHWESVFRDEDRDGGHDFGAVGSYLEMELNSAQRYDFLLSWDEWVSPNRDLDIEILDGEGEPLFDRYGRPYASRNTQTDGQFVEPLERIRGFKPPLAGKQKYRIRVLSATPEKTLQNPPQFELYVYPPPVAANPKAQPMSSLASGLATTQSEAVIPVGAEGFGHSSRGPTNDGRIRPDFSTNGALEFSNRRFEGTSFATPRVAAALGSVLARHPEWTLQQAVAYLKQFVSTDQTGKDNVLGWGALDLDAVVRSL